MSCLSPMRSPARCDMKRVTLEIQSLHVSIDPSPNYSECSQEVRLQPCVHLALTRRKDSLRAGTSLPRGDDFNSQSLTVPKSFSLISFLALKNIQVSPPGISLL